MSDYTQGDRELSITTPLGKDFLLITSLSGFEAISELFSFRLELLAELATKIQFDKVVGQKATVEMRLATGEKRYFDGIIKRLSQGKRDEDFVYYRAELVPKLWLLTKKVRSRIFQQMTVPDILNKVFAGFEVTYKLSATYYNRDYCVQYRESDFAFASRLMEEEGIYYFFDHSSDKHQLMVFDDPKQHPAVSGQVNVTYDEVAGGHRGDLRIYSWEKTQEVCSGEYTLWDHCFEQPSKNLEAKDKTIGSVTVGKVTHNLKVGGNDQLEIYDFPGGYAQRFDGITRSGGDQSHSLNDMYRDKDRTVRIRMEQEEIGSIGISGAGNCGYFSPGHRFTLERHFDADGAYLLTRVQHEARVTGNYRSSEALAFAYENSFSCVPLELPYRPSRLIPRPVIVGHQTATVVGPKGEEIFCDKYGRVKVQFHWDREGKKDGDSSCWVRVSQVWAGKGWGAFFWPRVGHEVVVAFEEGDPDQPLVIGSVYNAENMPWFGLPTNKMLCGFKSASFSGTAGQNYNGVIFNDQQGREHLSLHSERNLSLNSENDKMVHSGRHKGERVAVANVLTVGKLLPSGGSGGGDYDEGNPMPHSPPTGLLGLNAQTILGMNQQSVLGVNHSLNIGTNLQIVMNPLGYLAHDALPPTLAHAVGGGFGGNTQFTLGSNGQLTHGRNFDLCIGTHKAENEAKYSERVVNHILVGVLLALEAAYLLAYDLSASSESYTAPDAETTDDQAQSYQNSEQAGDQFRANLTIITQLAAAAIVAAMMALEGYLIAAAGEKAKALASLFGKKKVGDKIAKIGLSLKKQFKK